MFQCITLMMQDKMGQDAFGSLDNSVLCDFANPLHLIVCFAITPDAADSQAYSILFSVQIYPVFCCSSSIVP